jgi:hypothetical protein
MKKQIHLISLIILFLTACSEKNDCNNDTVSSKEKKCPCDSIGTFEIKGKNVTFCYINKSQIKIVPNNDTIDVTRFYTTDSIWHVQEYMVITKEQMIDSIFAIYSEFRDTANFYKLTYIMNEKLERSPGLVIDGTIGVDAVINNKDTLHFKSSTVLIPKEQFKGVVELIKTLKTTLNGKTSNRKFSMYVEAESMIKYGNLLEQYKAINRLCNLKGDAKP